MVNIIHVFTQGNDDCKHVFAYKQEGSMIFTYPPKYTYYRICEKCGKYELVETSVPYINESEQFDNIITKYIKDKR